MSPNILVVDDDEKLVKLLSFHLEKLDYTPIEAHDGDEAFGLFRRRKVDLIILDLMLPGIDGLSLCRRIRRESDVPIIMLTAKTEKGNRVEGLNLGADDYVTKPFSPEELMARVKAVLRRAEDRNEPEEITHGPLTISLVRHEVLLNNSIIDLTNAEYEILKALAGQPGRLFSRGQLLREIQDENYAGSERTIDVHITNLRSKIESDPSEPRFIHTIYGAGYKFELKKDKTS
ncbi:response regulator transcription factor [Candidatus Bipolaricaulota bacterium]|nr:response regulator transcription factor [Candidatus Bipolaricaulota bacterium]